MQNFGGENLYKLSCGRLKKGLKGSSKLDVYKIGSGDVNKIELSQS
jgi:hypothetical protein